MASLRGSLVAIVAAAALGASCSLINQFGPVKQGQGGAGTGGHASTSSSAGGSGGAGGGGSSATSGGGGSTPTTGSGGSGGGGSAPLGLIVATGNPSTGGARVFATIRPTDGKQLQLYTENVAVVLYDEATDLWYLFIDDDTLPPQPGNTVKLQVGQIDPTSGKWSKLAELSPVPVLRDYQSFAVLNHRIVYKAYDPESEAGFSAPVGLAIIDTTDTTPKLGGSRGFIQVSDFFGLIGTRANTIDGGTVNLISLEPCSVGMCQVDRTRVSFSADPSVDPGVNPSSNAAIIPPAPNMFSISAAWTSRVKNGASDILAYPPVSGTLGTIQPFNPASAQALTAVTWDATGSDQFYAVAIAECEDVALVTEQANQAIYAVSLTSGMSTSASTSNAAQILAYEPITHTVVAPLHIPYVPIVGYGLTVSNGMPTLAQRNWSTPTSLNADNVTVRRLNQPTTQSCQGL